MRQRSSTFLVGLAAIAALSLASATVAMAATMIGDGGPNELVGSERHDRILARGGDDTVQALGGPDLVHAGAGNDSSDGGEGRDLMAGGRGDDNQQGGGGSDMVFAGPGRDVTDGGDGRDLLWALARVDVSAIGDTEGDELSGGEGNDRFRVRDGEVDLVHCGGGDRDRVLADQFDQVDADCERVHRREVTSLAEVQDEQENRPNGLPAG